MTTSPLSLRLSAEAVSRGQLTEEDIEGFVVESRRLELQGQLYTRILGHIQDGEVRRLAHPGLIVRRVTPGVIRDVLAGICDIEPDRVDDLFRRLSDHVFLFEPDLTAPGEEDALRHRQDVREAMLNLMIQDPAWQDRLSEIHTRAINYYQDRAHPVTRAEEVYHRLMRGDEPELLDPLWSDDLTGSLSRCWQEPLTDRARLWLGPRIGQTRRDSEAWRTVDWEVSAGREAQEYLKMNDPQGALDILGQRKERSPDSALFWLEAEAMRQMGRLNEALAVCLRGLESTVEAGDLRESLKLHLLAGEIALAQSDGKTVDKHASRAIGVAEQLQDTAMLLAAQEILVRADNVLGTSGVSEHNRLQLERSFSGAGDLTLQNASDLSGRILQTAGVRSKRILRKAAVAFGNRSDQEVIKPDAFELEDLLAYVDDSEDGRVHLSKLAGEVGLSKEKFELRDLASSAIRYGRMGDAIATVLDSAGDHEEVRRKTLSMFQHDGLGDTKIPI